MIDIAGVRIGTYGDYSSKNYGANTVYVSIGSLTLYFSYETCIAFETPGNLRVSENVWSNTTGKHLNMIDRGRVERMDRDVFERELEKVLGERGLQ